jgi:hypothetical protein
MRTLACPALVLAALLVPASFLHADDRSDALAVVDDAIKAHGGADALAKAQAYTRKGAGTVELGKVMSLTDELTVSLPDRTRLVIDLEKMAHLVTVLNGDKAWESTGGPASDVTALRLQELRDEAYILWLATLTPLKKDGVTLKPQKEIKVNDKPAVGVSVTAKGRPDATLYFDKQSHLLVKIAREALLGGRKVDKEYLFADYKEVDGVQMPMKLTELVNGRKFSEIAVSSYKLSKPDDATFAKP